MNNVVYTKDNFVIIKVGNGFIVYNTDKEFEEGHSHLKNFKSAVNAITFCKLKKIPKDCRNYYLVTLQRISSDVVYVEKIEELLAVRKHKGKQPYYNTTGRP